MMDCILPTLNRILKHILLGVIIVLALTFLAQGQSLQTRLMIAGATVFVYAISDWILSKLLDFACTCDQHNGKNSNTSTNKNSDYTF